MCWMYANGDWEHCRDLVQEVSLSLWEHYGKLRPNAHAWEERAWVVWHTRSTLNHLHRAHRVAYQPMTPDIEARLVDEGNTDDTLSDELITILHDTDATIVRLRLEGYNADEIAERIGIKRDAVYQRLHRIVRRLQELNCHEEE